MPFWKISAFIMGINFFHQLWIMCSCTRSHARTRARAHTHTHTHTHTYILCVIIFDYWSMLLLITIIWVRKVLNMYVLTCNGVGSSWENLRGWDDVKTRVPFVFVLNKLSPWYICLAAWMWNIRSLTGSMHMNEPMKQTSPMIVRVWAGSGLLNCSCHHVSVGVPTCKCYVYV